METQSLLSMLMLPSLLTVITLRLPLLFPPSLPAQPLGVVLGEEDGSGAETSVPSEEGTLPGRVHTCDKAAPPFLPARP